MSPLRAAISKVDRAVRASPLAKAAIMSSRSSPIFTPMGPSPRWSLRARFSSPANAPCSRAWSTNTLHRESKALFTSKEGFSVVAPMSTMLPFSTKGKKASCWALLKR